ncbi:hypothetical protein P154DRAFT_615549 [Amniculicola lignicola CBS 123094]|uniref:Uncharacterized protein n=1 Tax=Amniculicola lignicola CBS 123094 TaxID=1392246 RepID=A0A6A5WZI0_9PLEO|nr:hypothetical protein P154DRAFT_615549 [Amniculicola lignicola CBS 123094]
MGTRGTSTSTTASKPGPTVLNLGFAAPSPAQTEHMGGSNTDPIAAQGQSDGRRSLEHPPGYTQAPGHAPAGTLNNGGENMGVGAGAGGAAWNMISAAGEALKKGEEAAWRAIRKK